MAVAYTYWMEVVDLARFSPAAKYNGQAFGRAEVGHRSQLPGISSSDVRLFKYVASGEIHFFPYNMLARCALRSLSSRPNTILLSKDFALRPTLVRMASTLPRLPIFEAIASHDPKSSAVIHSISGRRFTYGDLLHDVWEAKERLHQLAGGASTEGERIAFLAENGYDYVGASLPIPIRREYPAISPTRNSDLAFDTGYQINRRASFVRLSC